MGCIPVKSPFDLPLLESFGHVVDEEEEQRVDVPFGESFHNDFVLSKKVGKGAFGSVYLAWVRRGGGDASQVAVKVVDLGPKTPSGARSGEVDPKRKRSIDKEIGVLQTLPRSEHIVAFVAEYLEGNLAYIALELCDSGLLVAFDRMPAISENTMRLVLRDMLAGVVACHAACIVHRDIKADNFLAARCESALGFRIKLCDFGLAAPVSAPGAKELSGVYGTPPFMAPEMLQAHRYCAKVDVWAVGVLAYGLMFGTWPYRPSLQNGPAMKAAILEGVPPPYTSKDDLPKVSGTAVSWMQALLERDAAKRVSSSMALNHRGLVQPWAENGGVCFKAAISSARRVGAFDAPAKRQATPLDTTLRSMNSRPSMISSRLSSKSPRCGGSPSVATDISTESGSESPPASRYDGFKQPSDRRGGVAAFYAGRLGDFVPEVSDDSPASLRQLAEEPFGGSVDAAGSPPQV